MQFSTSRWDGFEIHPFENFIDENFFPAAESLNTLLINFELQCVKSKYTFFCRNFSRVFVG
jgi:hypothetical protein